MLHCLRVLVISVPFVFEHENWFYKYIINTPMLKLIATDSQNWNQKRNSHLKEFVNSEKRKCIPLVHDALEVYHAHPQFLQFPAQMICSCNATAELRNSKKKSTEILLSQIYVWIFFCTILRFREANGRQEGETHTQIHFKIQFNQFYCTKKLLKLLLLLIPTTTTIMLFAALCDPFCVCVRVVNQASAL